MVKDKEDREIINASFEEGVEPTEIRDFSAQIQGLEFWQDDLRRPLSSLSAIVKPAFLHAR